MKAYKRVFAVFSVLAIMLSCVGMAHAQSNSDLAVNKPGYGVTETQSGLGVNVRDAASLANSNIILSVPNDSYLMIVGWVYNSDEQLGFYKVQYNINGSYGYVYDLYLNLVSRNYYLKANTATDPLRFRSSPNTSASVIKKLPKGTYFAYDGYSGGWYSGVYGNRFGYTSGTYTQLLSY